MKKRRNILLELKREKLKFFLIDLKPTAAPGKYSVTSSNFGSTYHKIKIVIEKLRKYLVNINVVLFYTLLLYIKNF